MSEVITESGDPRDRITNQLPLRTAPERAADYHDDTSLTLRSSIAATLVMRTPAHAKAILDGRVRYESDAMTLGTTVHMMLLRDDRVVVSPYDEYRSKEAKEWKATAIALGQVPVKQKMWDEAREIAQACNGALVASNIRPTPFTNGQAEHAIRWEDNGADCRALMDWLRDDHQYIDDLKTTTDASPAKFRRHIFNMGYDLRAMFYVRGVEAVYGVTPEFRWVVVETNPPYPVSVFTLTDRAKESARVKVNMAISLWKDCLQTGEWPAYGDTVHEVEIPGWVEDMVVDSWAEADLDSVPF